MRTRLGATILALCVTVAMLASFGSSMASATQVPGRHTAVVMQRVSQARVPIISRTSSGRTPDAGGCSFKTSIPLTAYYDPSKPYTLAEVIVQVSDAPECSVTAILISEDVEAVMPLGVKTVVDKHCSECSELTVYGSYACTKGVKCAGKWTINETVVFALSPEYSFGAGAPGCTVSGPDDNILTCKYSKSTTVPSHYA
jgi:hypothetical protein